MDLPFLIQDMTGHWVRDCAMTTAEQRLIFLAFSQNSRPLGWQMIVIEIALIVHRDTLETARPLGQLGDQQEEYLHRQLTHLSVAPLFPAVNSWSFTSGVEFDPALRQVLKHLPAVCWPSKVALLVTTS